MLSLPNRNVSTACREAAKGSGHNEVYKIEVRSSFYIRVGAQNQIASFADNIMEHLRLRCGYVGDVLTDLMFKIKDLDV
jgi:hypothetical protein